MASDENVGPFRPCEFNFNEPVTLEPCVVVEQCDKSPGIKVFIQDPELRKALHSKYLFIADDYEDNSTCLVFLDSCPPEVHHFKVTEAGSNDTENNTR